MLRPFLTRVTPMKDDDGTVLRWFGSNTDVTEQHKHEEQLRLLVDELNHRVKNTLAVVQSMAAQSLKEPVDLASAGRNFASRLVAMSAAHDLLTQQTWKGAWIADVLRRALSPFVQDEDRATLSGPKVWITPKMALSLAMAIHELGTNATNTGPCPTRRERSRSSGPRSRRTCPFCRSSGMNEADPRYRRPPGEGSDLG